MHCWQIYCKECPDYTVRSCPLFRKKIFRSNEALNRSSLSLQYFLTLFLLTMVFNELSILSTYKGLVSFPSRIWLAPRRSMKFSALPRLWWGKSFTVGNIHTTHTEQCYLLLHPLSSSPFTPNSAEMRPY